MKTLFKGQSIEVFYQEGKSNAKCIFLKCRAVNPADGKTYEKTAGWISRNLAFHQCNKAPKYIFEAASNELRKNRSQIFPAVVKFFAKGGAL
jgi:hypothetical protein